MKKIHILGLASRNLKRKFIRTLLLLLIVAVVTGTLFSATIFMSGMQHALKIGTYRLGADILVVPAANEAQAKTALLAGEPTSFSMDRSVYEMTKKVDGVNRVSAQLFIKPTSFTCCFNVETFLVAFDPATDFTITPWLEKKLKTPLSNIEIITGREIPVMAGTTIPFFGTPFTVAATMDATGMKFFDQSVFMTMEAAYRMADDSKGQSLQPLSLDRNQISAVLVKVNEDITPDRVAIRIEHAIDGVRAIASDEVINTVRRQLAGLLQGIVAISAVLWALALIMVGFAFYMIVNERQREIGLLRAMGAKKGHIFSMIIMEAMMTTFGGGVLGLTMGAGLLYALKDVMTSSLKLPYLLPETEVLLNLILGTLIFSVLTGLLSALIPAAAAGRMEPYDAVRRGE